MSDVAIVGIGMHPFGRHEGVSGMEQGAHAVREACKDAGVEWQDVQFDDDDFAESGPIEEFIPDPEPTDPEPEPPRRPAGRVPPRLLR